MVTLRDSSCSSSREFATKLEADVPIVVDGAAVNVTAGAAFKRYKANIREEQVEHKKTLWIIYYLHFHTLFLLVSLHSAKE